MCAAGKGFGSEQAPVRQARKSEKTSVPNTTGKSQGSGRGKQKPQAAEDADSKVFVPHLPARERAIGELSASSHSIAVRGEA